MKTISVVVVLCVLLAGIATYRYFMRGDFAGSVCGNPKAIVIFDFDGTVCDSMPCLIHTFQKHAARYGIPSSMTISQEDMREYHARDVFKNLLIPSYKIPLVLRDFRIQWEQERDIIGQIVDLKPLLEYLKNNNYAVGIVTSNSLANVQFFLKKEGLASYVDFIGSSPSVFGKKYALNAALKRVHQQQNRILYIGDEMRDVDAGRAIGAECVAVTWGMNSEAALQRAHADAVCSSPQEVIEYLNC